MTKFYRFMNTHWSLVSEQRATVWQGNNKCQHRSDGLSMPRGGVNRAPAMRRPLMSIRSLECQAPLIPAEPWLVPWMAPSASGAEVFDQFSGSTKQRQNIGCQTSAFLVELDALVRAPLPARLASLRGLTFTARLMLWPACRS